MRTVSRAVAAGLVIIAAANAGACGGGPPADMARTAAPAAIEWREVGTWSGSGNRQTESFEVSMSALRLRWKTTRETSPGAGHLTVTVHSAVSGRPLRTLVDAQGLGSDTVDVADELRWCHFVIEGSNVDWWMTLEQGYPATVAPGLSGAPR